MSDVAPESLVLPRVRPAKPLKISFAFWGLHTPGKSSAYKLIFLNYLKIRLFSTCSIWNDEKIFQFRGGKYQLFLNFTDPAVLELGTCGLADQSYTYCVTEKDNRYWRYKLFCNALNRHVVTRCHTGCRDINTFL